MSTPQDKLPLEKLPGNKYPLKAPPAAHVAEIEATLRTSEPPRYASQLKRRGGKVDVTAGDAAAMKETDDMIDGLEQELVEELAKEAEQAAEVKTKAKGKAKSKTKPKSKPAAPAKLASADGPDGDEVLEESLPYPEDAYEPPAHITANHIYSNVYRRTMTNGLNKEAAAEAGRVQALIFRTHGVVSKSMVGTFRQPKAGKAHEK